MIDPVAVRMRYSPKDVAREVASIWNVLPDAIWGKKRSHDIMEPRHVSVYLSRKLFGWSLPKIGSAFNRHHTTILHSDEVVRAKMQIDPDFTKKVEYAELRVTAALAV